MFDVVVASSAAAGLRRTAGIDLATMARNSIKNDTLRTGAGMFFKVGEVTVDSAAKIISNYQNRDKDAEIISRKDDEQNK